jgi:hypothetical protein
VAKPGIAVATQHGDTADCSRENAVKISPGRRSNRHELHEMSG